METRDDTSKRIGYAIALFEVVALIAFIAWGASRDPAPRQRVPVSYHPANATAPDHAVSHDKTK